jgi:prolipoprotein diacylglyceryltransferase
MCLYAAAYGAFRFFLEFARGDFRGGTLAGLSPSQVIALVALVLGAAVIVLRRRRGATPPAPQPSSSS